MTKYYMIQEDAAGFYIAESTDKENWTPQPERYVRRNEAVADMVELRQEQDYRHEMPAR